MILISKQGSEEYAIYLVPVVIWQDWNSVEMGNRHLDGYPVQRCHLLGFLNLDRNRCCRRGSYVLCAKAVQSGGRVTKTVS